MFTDRIEVKNTGKAPEVHVHFVKAEPTENEGEETW